MSQSMIISLAAIFISLSSLAVTFWSVWRDRPQLKFTSHFYPSSEYGSANIRVRVVNAGRRPLILRLIGGDYSGGYRSGTYLGDSGKGLRLGEHEFFEESITRGHHMCLDAEGKLLIRLWFEDSLGRRYVVPESERDVKALFS